MWPVKSTLLPNRKIRSLNYNRIQDYLREWKESVCSFNIAIQTKPFSLGNIFSSLSPKQTHTHLASDRVTKGLEVEPTVGV